MRADGSLRWAEGFHNLVVDEGLDEMLQQVYKGVGFVSAQFVGLTDASPTFAAGDTMASHAGWAELTPYSESVRELYFPDAASGGSAVNPTNKAIFNITSSATLGGAFISTDDTKGGTAGILIGGGTFPSDQDVESGDVLTIETTVTITSV